MNAASSEAGDHVVVGVDGSHFARHAVNWAADEAVLRGARLELLHAWDPKAFGAHDWYGDLLRDAGAETLRTEAARVRRWHAELTVTTQMAHGNAATVLADASTRAGLLVVGRRGLGGFAGMLMGSVSRSLAGHSACPLLVAPADERGDTDGSVAGRGIVVGVADTSCVPAVAVGFAEASLRRLPVRVVHAWSLPPVPMFGLVATQPPPGDEVFRAARHDAEAMLRQVVEPVGEHYPDVHETAEVVNRTPADALVGLSADAVLVVVAAHRRRHGVGWTLGPVGYAVLHHARSPVLLVPVR